jgi:UDPglucose--hexose-1-phosphate uridylyltransferase
MIQKKSDVIDSLIYYAQEAGWICKRDEIYYRNRLCQFFQVEYTSSTNHYSYDEIKDFLIKEGYLMEDVLNVCLPIPSVIQKKFGQTRKNKEQGLFDFYTFCQKAEIVNITAIQKNTHQEYDSKYGKLLITINSAKPEKDPKKIKEASLIKSTSYPLCAICKENEGLTKKENSKSNLRILEINLHHKKFYFQYSPYSYFPYHSIVLSPKHTKIKISKMSFIYLLDFVKQYPTFFIGSNADLPIVGGSILSHFHFQSGINHFPMDDATSHQIYQSSSLKIGILDWPMYCLRLTSKNEETLINASTKILAFWQNYENKKINLIPYIKNIPHHTLTVIAHLINGEFQLDLIFRSNYTDDEHPYGLFHVDETFFGIKKENIGLVEAMGEAILPGRLQNDLPRLEEALKKKEPLDELVDDFKKYIPWITWLKTKGKLQYPLQNCLGITFEEILSCCNIFRYAEKEDEERLAFSKKIVAELK